MKTRPATATDMDGNSTPADLLLCAECSGAHFQVFVIRNGCHQHLQCVACGASYCDGTCVDLSEPEKGTGDGSG